MTENYQYIRAIVQILNAKKITDAGLKDEFVDHYCTVYESMIADGMDPQMAMSEIRKQVLELDFSTLKKSNKMLQLHRITLLAAFLIFGAVSTFFMTSKKLETDIACAEPTSLDMTSTYEHVYQVSVQDPPYGSPIANSEISSGFGQRRHPVSKVMKFHKGCDFKAAAGTTVISVESGTVIDCGYDKLNGNYIEIKHDEIYSTRYHHLRSIIVKKDQKIDRNQKIGEVGSTGLSTGPHLHYEIIKSGTWVDVAEYLKA